MVQRFVGKVAIVTGAGSGIGFATAKRLSAEGAAVVAAVFDKDQLSAVGAFDGQVMDVRDEADWDRVLAHIVKAHGGLDVLVNNAGVHRVAGVEETTREIWDFISDTNLYGTLLGCRKAIPLLRRRGGGAIVNLSSFAAIRGVPRQVAYATSKGGILAMTLALAVDHVHERIRVNCVCPGATGTPIIDALVATSDDPDRFREQLAARSPMGVMARPEEVAAAIAYLASDDATNTTGITLPVDGGRSGR
ncbi:SDR family oxidoreductase [Stappia sp. GBMRC 2046]|uniref:SDR family oxidoreductase n=1 Tax=Stappia sediminis TaxID=2692190 RepID=A0A7X3LY88_9HYPH|nr:SDR family NAD(P)-dependent oxidoreductase [Stappia sediminis]MXN67314.1 SDR family oxidoreductase [Stappia sediminis]